MDPNLFAATLGAPAAGGNTLGASMYNEISNAGAIDRKLPTSTGLANESINIAQDQVEAQKRAAALAAQKQQDLSDYDKYRKVEKEDGGFDFFDPEGNQIDIATLSQRTGKKPQEIIKDSKNPIDIQYRTELGNLNGLLQALANKDEKRKNFYISEAAKDGIDLKPYLKDKGKGKELLDAFYQSFKRYYVPQSQNPTAWGANNKSLVPTHGNTYSATAPKFGSNNSTGYQGAGGGSGGINPYGS